MNGLNIDMVAEEIEMLGFSVLCSLATPQNLTVHWPTGRGVSPHNLEHCV